MLDRTALEALTRRPVPFLASAWPWRGAAYLPASLVPGAAGCCRWRRTRSAPGAARAARWPRHRTLDLPPAADGHRWVLAVLAYLRR